MKKANLKKFVFFAILFMIAKWEEKELWDLVFQNLE